MQPLYSIGDKVVVRSWDDLCNEFEAWHDGDLKTPACFVTAMKIFCGCTLTICDVHTFDGDFAYHVEEDSDGYWFDECALIPCASSLEIPELAISFEDAVLFGGTP